MKRVCELLDDDSVIEAVLDLLEAEAFKTPLFGNMSMSSSDIKAGNTSGKKAGSKKVMVDKEEKEKNAKKSKNLKKREPTKSTKESVAGKETKPKKVSLELKTKKLKKEPTEIKLDINLPGNLKSKKVTPVNKKPVETKTETDK